MNDHVASEASSTDPRVRRTRGMLHRALDGLLRAKPFTRISVGDIAEAATLNRATFYAHYADKYALLEGLVASRFAELLVTRAVVFDGSCPGALRGIALATCDFLAELRDSTCPERRREVDGHYQSALLAVVRETIASGLARDRSVDRATTDLVAATMSGAIYGAADDWARSTRERPASEAVEFIVRLVGPMLARDAADVSGSYGRGVSG